MKKSLTLDQKDFNSLLLWLDEDIEIAGVKYQRIREKLVKFFVGRGLFDAEDLADDAINRVAAKCEQLGPTYEGEKSSYFYGVARKIYLETTHRKNVSVEEIELRFENSDYHESAELKCLDNCLKKLPAHEQQMILDYYQSENSTKYKHRQGLAEALNLSVGKLRVRTFRIRAALRDCLEECLKK